MAAQPEAKAPGRGILLPAPEPEVGKAAAFTAKEAVVAPEKAPDTRHPRRRRREDNQNRKKVDGKFDAKNVEDVWRKTATSASTAWIKPKMADPIPSDRRVSRDDVSILITQLDQHSTVGPSIMHYERLPYILIE